jgi:hypothetical protein
MRVGGLPPVAAGVQAVGVHGHVQDPVDIGLAVDAQAAQEVAGGEVGEVLAALWLLQGCGSGCNSRLLS